MKKMILGLAALVMVSASFAQPTPGEYGKGRQHEMRNHHGGANMFEKLNLTDTQKAQVKSINEDFRKQMKDLESKENITVKEQRDRKDALRKAHQDKIQALLTADQKTQLYQLKADGEKRRAEMSEKHLSMLKEKLSLTDAQVSTIKSKQATTKSKMDAILRNDALQGSERKDQMTALREEMKKNVESVLTPEQKTKMEELRKENHEKMKSRGNHGLKDGVK
jgi:Spy/CpxP family protein refolding chaperone